MSTAPAFASVTEAIDMARAALGYLAAADATALPAEAQAECLRGLERTDAIATAARASFLAAFTIGQGYSADADYSPRAWLMHKTGITRAAAASHTAWATRVGTHPRVVAALAAGELSESYGRAICRWTDKLPEKFREESDELLVAAALAGLGLADLAALFAEMYERARGDLPDEDPERCFADRGVRLVTTFQGAGVLTGDLTPECAAVVGAVLDALSAPAGAEDDRTRDQRYHDGLQEAMASQRAAWTAARATISRCPGRVIACSTARISSSVIGSRLGSGTAAFSRWAGLAKISPRFLANRNSDRTAEIVVWSGCPRSLSSPALMSSAVTSRRWPRLG